MKEEQIEKEQIEKLAIEYAQSKCNYFTKECIGSECTCNPILGNEAEIRRISFINGWIAAINTIKH